MPDTISARAKQLVPFSPPACRRAFLGAFFAQCCGPRDRIRFVARGEIRGSAGGARTCAAGRGAKNVNLSRGFALGHEAVPADRHGNILENPANFPGRATPY